MENLTSTMETNKVVSNRVELIGHVGQEPKIFKFDSGKVKASFSLAVSEGYKNANGEWVNSTQWVNISAWGKLAEDVEANIGKGHKIHIIGKLNNREYKDKEGNTKYSSEVMIYELKLIPKK